MRSAFYADVSPTALRALNYAPEVEAFRRPQGRRSIPLREMLSSLGPSYGAVFVRVDCDPRVGERLYDQGSMFATEPAPRWIRGDRLSKLEAHRIQRWQVLIAGAGQASEGNLFGTSIVADGRLAGGIVGPHAMALTFREPGGELNLYTYAFLISAVGIAAVRSTAYGSSVPGLRKDLLSRLPVPLGTDEQVARVAAHIRETVAQREAYAAHLGEARALLEWIPGFSEARAMCERRERRAIWWDGALPTLAASNFASTGGATSHLRATWRRTLRDVLAPGGLYAGLRFARVPCEAPNGVPLYSQRDIYMIRPVPRRVMHPGFADRLVFAPEHAILVACDGQVGEGTLFGRAELAQVVGRAAITQHVLRVVPSKSMPWLYAFLSSSVGWKLLQATAVGTSVPTMRTDLVAQIPIPDPSPELAAQIDRLVEAAIEARLAADRAESEAVRIIEQEVLPAWLA